MLEEHDGDYLIVLAAHPRRVTRLIGYISIWLAGLFFVLQAPITITKYMNSTTPAILWGVLMLLGSCVSIWAWFNRILILDRIGLTLIGTALFASTLNQGALWLEDPGWTRGGYVFLFLFAIAFTVSRWLDVKLDEETNAKAINLLED